jgi:hypothetical protein
LDVVPGIPGPGTISRYRESAKIPSVPRQTTGGSGVKPRTLGNLATLENEAGSYAAAQPHYEEAARLWKEAEPLALRVLAIEDSLQRNIERGELPSVRLCTRHAYLSSPSRTRFPRQRFSPAPARHTIIQGVGK